ncbi:hypothetical protein FYJ51_06230 [Erysipelotrichaceae bacterium Oil+RF-744-GAM-WT-6]|uniref:Barstar (barnase inhibitor) domain-containing protein n=1 Tax=Stecheria intestinalis TaxID=2606630 RepID=A0A7X2NS00_9FIRM|nr:barstar family protein [Stecheria intestinalis]MDD7679898.1 barstar family protein [Stecheria intestinalis]MDY4681313.1 barstar family protein [Lachnospiraceae bacterium]MSS58499.1 hypothetical protein [Stecheria intestinalis]
MKRMIELDPEKIRDKTSMSEYMTQTFFPDQRITNLDALRDSLSELEDDTAIVLTPAAVHAICQNPYAYKVLMVLGKSAEENPHLRIQFRNE